MKNNDDLLSMQGNVYTLVDAEGYLVREDINGSRKRYPLTSGGGSGVEYTPGEGIFISDNEISVDGSFIDDKIHNYITYETDFDSRIDALEKAGGGSGEGGVSYTEGDGIIIGDNIISLDDVYVEEKIGNYIDSNTDIYSRITDLEDNAGGLGERLDDYEGRLTYIEENFDGDQIYSRLGDLEEQVGNISDVIDLINGENV